MFAKEIKNIEDTTNFANGILFKSRKIRSNTVESLLAQVDESKPNKMYLFYYLLDLHLIVDISPIYP